MVKQQAKHLHKKIENDVKEMRALVERAMIQIEKAQEMKEGIKNTIDKVSRLDEPFDVEFQFSKFKVCASSVVL